MNHSQHLSPLNWLTLGMAALLRAEDACILYMKAFEIGHLLRNLAPGTERIWGFICTVCGIADEIWGVIPLRFEIPHELEPSWRPLQDIAVHLGSIENQDLQFEYFIEVLLNIFQLAQIS